MTFDLAAIRPSRHRVPRWIAWAVAGVAVIALFGMMNANAQARWTEIRMAFDDAVVAATLEAVDAARFDAPGTAIVVGDPSNDTVPVTVTSPSQEVCFYGWSTFAPISAMATFSGRDLDADLIIADSADEDAMALDHCASPAVAVTYQVRR